MGQLIDDLLAFSRTSRQVLAKRSVDPAEIVRQVLEELHSELERHLQPDLQRRQVHPQERGGTDRDR
jgi:signal transduction histidine kinase